MSELDVETIVKQVEVMTLSVKEGDIVVFKVPEDTSMATIHAMRKGFATIKGIPKVPFLIFAGDLEISKITKDQLVEAGKGDLT